VLSQLYVTLACLRYISLRSIYTIQLEPDPVQEIAGHQRRNQDEIKTERVGTSTENLGPERENPNAATVDKQSVTLKHKINLLCGPRTSDIHPTETIGLHPFKPNYTLVLPSLPTLEDPFWT